MAFDLVRDLPAALADRPSAWSYIRGFAETWRTPLTVEDGTPETELAEAEARLGLRLPAAVREAYALFGRCTDLHSNMQHLLLPGALFVDDRKEALVFRTENQGAASWGILLAELDTEDPPVRVRPDLADKSAERWEGWLGSFSCACIEIVLTEALLADDPLCDSGDHDGRSELARLPFPAYDGAQPGSGFYTAPGLLLWDADGWLSVRARDEDTLARFRATYPADWLNA